ncbi:MAG: DNA-binding response regulator [Cytophagales bacterium]|nr:MAG: DNA-binding response regulator [Cytophagales bacterium]
MAALHNQQESIIDAEASSELDSQKTYRAYLLWIVGVLLAAGGVIGYSFWRYRQRKEREIAFMKHELKRFIEATKHPPTDEPQPPKTTFNVLSDRQRDVLDYMARGLSNKEIADQLFISENTVKYHIKNIYLLLEIKDRKSFLANMER